MRKPADFSSPPTSIDLLTPSFLITHPTPNQPPQPTANCSTAFEYHLSRSSAQITPLDFSATLISDQTVTVDLLLAVGYSPDQLQSGKHKKLLGWLHDWSNVQLMLSSAGIDTAPTSSITAGWLQRPELIALQAARKANVRLAVGLAVPLGVCFTALVAVVAFLAVRHRRNRRAQLGGDDLAAKVAGKQVRG